jgi:hypothetical protein
MASEDDGKVDGGIGHGCLSGAVGYG